MVDESRGLNSDIAVRRLWRSLSTPPPDSLIYRKRHERQFRFFIFFVRFLTIRGREADGSQVRGRSVALRENLLVGDSGVFVG